MYVDDSSWFGLMDYRNPKESGGLSQTNFFGVLDYYYGVLRLGFRIWGFGRVLGTNSHGFATQCGDFDGVMVTHQQIIYISNFCSGER